MPALFGKLPGTYRPVPGSVVTAPPTRSGKGPAGLDSSPNRAARQ